MASGISADVTVVGYGPTGQALALLLARMGHDVLVVERWPDLYPLPRAVHFDQEAARILQATGAIWDIEKVTEDIERYEWRNADRELLLALEWAGQGMTGWQISTMFAQPELECVLDRHVKSNPRITVMQGWAAVGLDEEADGIALTIVQGAALNGDWRATGEQKSVKTKYVVGADGANSFVRDAIGVEIHNLGFAFDWLVVDVVPKEQREWKPKTWQLCDPARPTTVVPGGPGRRRWEFMLLPGEDAKEMNRADVAWDLLKPWAMTPDNSKLERHAVYRFGALWAERWRSGRAFLAGDAAHLMPPFAGQGMCSGLRDVCALAWRLDLVLKGAAADSVLDSYGPERIAHVREMINFSIELGEVICITDPEQAAQRDRDMLAARNAPGYEPPPPLLPPLGAAGLYVEGDPLGGRLSPQGRVSVGGASGLFDDVLGLGFALIVRTQSVIDSIGGENRTFLEMLGTRLAALDRIDDLDGVYGEWLSSRDATAILVRPDFYVFGVAARQEDVDPLIGKLKSALSAVTMPHDDATTVRVVHSAATSRSPGH